ncbi:hypothetical protein BDQ12DRAFT_171989 [Crucibulum laeve]|uniref:Scd2/ral3 n=1 Tax=Crucibulum laeve TaxID=68775 RepID=A0A5C3MCV2_9AGAR|nr:hypothetical protein BDQ12DRAFT_171989 [Crucibulum laeve]
MKSLRKSLNGGRESSRPQISTPLPLPSVSKPPSAILPPQKVIRALSAYRSQAPQQLSFSKGDFFYVLKDVDEQGAWYEAHNPVSGARGLVPRSMFEEFNKNNTPVRTSQIGPGQGPPRSAPVNPPPKPAKTQVFYAIVLHDFAAERADELDAKRGDAITVVAQSNREWFVAKPIGRLGRPGLIPVSFVEIHDPATGKAIPDVDDLMDRGDLPKVEDWKRAMLTYKQNSIALGVIDAPVRDSMANSTFMSQDGYAADTSNIPSSYPPPEPPRSDSPECLPEGILLSADVVTFHFEMEEYWFRINAVFQPYVLPGQNRLPPAKQLVLFRVYNDFYDFQVSLLETFPREAGREPPHHRTLPFMPGPADKVDDALTATRRIELDDYLHSLCSLNKTGGRRILEHEVVRQFLALKPGDIENEAEARTQEIEELFAEDTGDQDFYDGQEYETDVRDQMDRLKVNGDKSDSEYEDEGYAASPRNTYDRQNSYGQNNDRRPSDDGSARLHAHSYSQSQSHQRSGSSSSFNNPSSHRSHSRNHSRSNSPYDRGESPQPLHNGDYFNQQQRQQSNAYPNGSTPSTSSFRSSQAMSQRSRSHSTATTTNLNTPPISAANPQTAFVKIKIFDRVADELIAIRVHPKVTHSELMDKVQTRLGGEVAGLRYRNSVSNTFVGLDNDGELREWMEGTDKHVLYAD